MNVIDFGITTDAYARDGAIAIFDGMLMAGLIAPIGKEKTQKILSEMAEIGALVPGVKE
jgi:hypothetical protein